MLNELFIENFAIIDRLELSLDPGLNIFTGETGAGKSIIIDAVELVLGSRADISMLRTGAEKASVEATFELSESAAAALQEILQSEELTENSRTLVLAREIRRNGRSVARINGHMVSIGLLSELAEYLVDVHGQSEHLSLLHVRHHLNLLDNYAHLDHDLSAYQKTYHELMDVRHELAALRQAESETARRMDILAYQINEIESARLHLGEEEELKEERNRLANAEGLASLTQEMIVLLDEGTSESPAATDLLGQALAAMNNLARLDPSQTGLDEQAQLVFDNLEDLVASLRTYLEGIEFNPRRLDQVEERLNLIHNLKRKYGRDIQAVLDFALEAHRQQEAITHAGERIAELEDEQGSLLSRLALEGQALSKKRREAAVILQSSMEAELEQLNMTGAQFKVDFQQRPDITGIELEDGQRVAFDVTGLEKVEFLVAPNQGEGLKSLVKTASGGETSRLMLGIKNILAQADQVPTLIFDEIDQGIGGRVGTTVGRKLWELAQRHQVLCVTHLPQLAAFGSKHLHVYKDLQDGRTLTRVEDLHGEQRLLELAQMMGEVSEGTRRSAQEILQSVEMVKTPVN